MPRCLLVATLALLTPLAVLAGPDAAPATADAATSSAFPDPRPAACDPCESSCLSCLCGPPGRLAISAEWLFASTSGNPLPPLVTTSPPGTPQASAGVLIPGPTTLVLFGDRRYDGEMRSGLRTQAVYWLDDCQTCGLYGDFFFLGRANSSFIAGSPGGSVDTAPVAGRPFINALTGLPDAEFVAFPGQLGGLVAAETYTDVIGGGAGFVKNLCCSPCGRLDLTLGYRYLRLTDDLTITESLTTRDGSQAPAGTTFAIRDHFRARNDFHGASIGLSGERRLDRLFFAGWASVAMGVSHQVLTVDGATVIRGPGGVTAGPGGLLTAPSNIGTYEQDKFAVLPEVGVRAGYQLTPRLRTYVGYTFLYVSRVTRTGDMIDLRVNPNQFVPAAAPVAGPAYPAFSPGTSGFWMQGVSVGAQFFF